MTTRSLTTLDTGLLRTATLNNMNWSSDERFTPRDIDQAQEIRQYFAFRPERGDFGVVAERDGNPVGVVWLLFLERATTPATATSPTASPS